MHSLYHLRPGDMVGTVLYPLNTLKTLHPAIYERQAAKYRDHPSRVGLPLQVIPKLGCLWNDVVQCAPIHPHLLYRELQARGARVNPELAWFEIPLSAVAGLPVAVFDRPGPEDPTLPPRDEEVTWLDPQRYAELDAVPTKTLQWYDRIAREGRVYGMFVGIPHVLVQGPIDVGEARIIHWSWPPPGE